MAHDVLLSDSATARNIFRKDYVQQHLDEHMSGDYNHQYRLWALLMLELWFRMWVDQPLEVAMRRPTLEPV
jgi:asparagine synthase (glutamine-hydrolysing)